MSDPNPTDISTAMNTPDPQKVQNNLLNHSNGVYLSVVLAEPFLFLHGNAPYEYSEQSPAILRGSLVVKCTKSVKLKSISMNFKGVSRTEWPEGIPPKKVEVSESNELYSHSWPFFNAQDPTAELSSGAHMVRPIKDSRKGTGNISSNYHESDTHHNNHHHHDISSGHLGKLLNKHRFKKSASSNNNSPSNPSTPEQLSPQHSSSGINTQQPSPRASSSNLHQKSLNLAPHRSFSKDEPRENDVQQKGYRVFAPGEYIYNFELPISNSMPESIACLYGTVNYFLEASVERYGTFKPNLLGRKDIKLVRAASLNNVETSEPITVSKDWEDQMHYDIVVAGKAFPLGSSIPIALKFTPYAKVQLHRIRIYMTENVEYYCRQKRVHRVEPMRKYLLKEHLPQNGLSGTLINLEENTTDDLLSLATEMEFQVYVPKVFGTTRDVLHPNTTHEDIQVHHWLKIVLRLSRLDNENNGGGKRRYFEIAIDSPVTLLHNLCTTQNLGLPQYQSSTTRSTRSPSSVGLSGPSTAYPSTNDGDESRPIHYIRMPSIAPPPFKEVDDYSPPRYETVIREKEQEEGRHTDTSTYNSRANSITLHDDTRRQSGSSSGASLTHSQSTEDEESSEHHQQQPAIEEQAAPPFFTDADISERFKKFKFERRNPPNSDSDDEREEEEGEGGGNEYHDEGGDGDDPLTPLKDNNTSEVNSNNNSESQLLEAI